MLYPSTDASFLIQIYIIFILGTLAHPHNDAEYDVLTFPNVDGFTCALLNYFTYDFQLPFEGAQIPIVHVSDRIHIWSR